MVRLIRKMLPALIKKCKVIFFAMIFVSTLGVAMGSGFLSTYVSFKNDSTTFFNDYGLPDVTLTLDNYYKDEEIKNIFKDTSYNLDYRFKYNFNGAINNYPITIETKTINESSFTKLFYHEQVDENPNYINIKIHKAFASKNNLKAGDTISFGIRNLDKMMDAKISAIVSSPESINYVLNRSIGVDKYDFAFAFISQSELNKVLPSLMQNKINQIIVKSNEDHNKIKSEITKRLNENNINVLDSYTREESPSISYINNLYRQMRTISLIVPLIFLVITLTLIFLFLLQIIRSFLHEIGIMHALGIKKKKILGLMVSFSLTNSVIASILGIGISFALTHFMSNMYESNYSIPYVNHFPNVNLCLIVTLIMIAISVLASITTMFVIRKITPKDAIVNNASQFKPLPKVINKVIEKRSIASKININNVHKNFLRFLVSVFTFACSYTIIFGAINYYCSNQKLISQLGERFNYNAEVYSMSIIPCDDMEERNNFISSIGNLSSISESTPSLLTSVKLSFNNQESDINLCGVKTNQSLIFIPSTDNKQCDISPNTIVLEQEIANRFNIHVNDVVNINDYPLTVSQISYQSVSKYQYIEYDTYLTKIKPNITLDVMVINMNNKDQFIKEIVDIPINSHTTFSDKYIDSTTSGFVSTQIAAIAIVIFSFAIGFLIIFIMNLDNLDAQKRKFSILSSLGKKKKYILSLLLRQCLTNFIIGIAIGIPVGIGFANILINVANNDVSTMIFVNYWWIYLIALGAVIIYLISAYLISRLIIKNWNISENIKTRE